MANPDGMTHEERVTAILLLAGQDIPIMLNMRLEREGFRLRLRRRGNGYPARVEWCDFVNLVPGRDIVFGDPPAMPGLT